MFRSSETPVMLADVLAPDRNSFSAVRLLLALAVVVSHAFVLATGNRTDEPFLALTGYKLGDHAVAGFFVLSGLVTAASLDRRRSAVDFLLARALRILPLVAAYGIVFTLLVAPFLTRLDPVTFLLSPATWEYLVRVVALAPGNPTLPGLFDAAPLKAVVNEPLWTLKYEVLCYLALALGAGLLARFGRSALAVAAAAIIAFYVVTLPWGAAGGTLGHLRHFGLAFALGVGAYAIADRLPVSAIMLAVVGAIYVIAFGGPLHGLASVLLVGYGAVWLGAQDLGGLTRFARESDLSYGIYVLGWPVGQIIADSMPGISIASLLALNLLLVVPLAMLSWALIEEPALRLKPGAPAAAGSGEAGDMAAPSKRDADGLDATAEAAEWSGNRRDAAATRVYSRPITPRGM